LQVGQRFVSASRSLDEAQIKVFASQFDPQPFHLDAEAAEGTFFGQLVASGWHTAAMTMRLIVESVPVAGGIVGADAEISWPATTRPGAILHAESEVMELRPSKSRPERGMVTVRTETRNQDGQIVQVLVSKLVVPRRAPLEP
jgi:acyl dehydratase